MLGGPAITKGIENPTTLALDGSGNLYVGNSTASNEGDVSVYAPKSEKPQRILSGIIGVPKGLAADAAGRLTVIAQYRSGCCEFRGHRRNLRSGCNDAAAAFEGSQRLRPFTRA